MRGPIALAGCFIGLLLIASSGCVRRTLTVTTDPPGAMLFLNNVEVGRTPFERDFIYYGTYDVVLRKEGYDTLKTRGKVIAPWWQWVPIDLLAEFLPLHDRQNLTYTLHPTSTAAIDPKLMLSRAEAMSTKLESSPLTHPPVINTWTTRPSTRATTRTSTMPR